MATAKLLLDTRSIKKDGTYPVKLSVYHRSTTLLGLDISVRKDQWDGNEIKNHPKSKKFNEALRIKKLLK